MTKIETGAFATLGQRLGPIDSSYCPRNYQIAQFSDRSGADKKCLIIELIVLCSLIEATQIPFNKLSGAGKTFIYSGILPAIVTPQKFFECAGRFPRQAFNNG